MASPARPAVELWADGSGTRIGEPGGWAYILRCRRGDEWIQREGSGGEGSTTNNRMEISAVLEGLRALRQPCLVDLYSDSEYVVNAFAKGWLTAWANRNWRKVKNDDLWREVVRAAMVHRVTGNWVRGHSGVELNERCDMLAGIERQKRLAMVENF